MSAVNVTHKIFSGLVPCYGQMEKIRPFTRGLAILRVVEWCGWYDCKRGGGATGNVHQEEMA